MTNGGLQDDAAYAMMGIIFVLLGVFLAMSSDDPGLALAIVSSIVGSSFIIISALERLKRR